jgi:hypothetical protein
MMTEVEQKVYVAIAEIKRLLPPMIDNVLDNDIIRYSTENLSDQLLKVVGARIIKETKRNGQI